VAGDQQVQKRRDEIEVADAAASDEEAPLAVDDAAARSPWSNLWQVPTILLSALLIALGMHVASRRAPENDFHGALDQAEALIAAGHFDRAGARLTDVVEPHLDLAAGDERARFHAVLADWIYLSQAAAGVAHEVNNRRVAEGYVNAVELGMPLDPARLERWANALIALGDLEGASRRLRELGELDVPAGAMAEVRVRRNRLLRSLVEESLRQPELSYDEMMEILGAYRTDQILSVADELWAIARQTELRLEANLAQPAIDRLLVDMRRIEPDVAPAEVAAFGELYGLLGRGYFELGQFEHAEYYLNEALARLPEPDRARGDALVLLGQIDVSRSALDEAFEQFDLVVRQYPNTRSYLPGLLGRAAVRSVRGDHEGGLADYGRLCELLSSAGPRRDVTPSRVSASLADRHDAALATGKLMESLQYILLAEAIFEPAEVPAYILLRLASTGRQIADNLLAEALSDPATGVGRVEDIDPAVRREANRHYKRAGDHYARHARVVVAIPNEDETWSESLWLAADSYDLGGERDRAIAHFREYIAGHSADDPRRSVATFRLAQAHHAKLDYAAAAQAYEQVIADHPRSPDASRSHVPLARCYLALGQRDDAERQLEEVVAGERHLKPDALDYRDALIELGKLYHDGDEYASAIKILDEGAKRYSDDPRINDVLYRLGDSYRGQAGLIAKQLSNQPILSRAERDRLDALRTSHLQTAMNLFADVGRRFEEMDADRLTPLQRDFQRYATLYQGDCAYDLEHYDEAIRLFDRAARKYRNHHSSMTALIQIVNCYHELGDTTRARAAHHRALVRLKQLPDDAFDAPDALMDRNAWERWLQHSPLGETQTAGAASS
jgi:TolA-binding protein